MLSDSYKVLLVKPDVLVTSQVLDVPLGVLYLSAFLKKHLKNDIEIAFIDLRMVNDQDKTLKELLETFNPDLVGISLLAFEQSFIFDYADFIKKYSSAKIVVGGPFPTYNYEKILLESDTDCAVIGEGERVFFNLISGYIEKKDISGIKGIAYYNGETVICNPREEHIGDLDSIPYPDYSLIDFKNYWGYHIQHNTILAERKYAPIISSRACPYQCIYCHNIFGKKIRERSPENTLGEIKLLYEEYGIREIHLVDDVFNFNRKRMHQLLHLIINSNMTIRIAFPNGLRGDLLTREDIALLKKAGTYTITFAIESASQRIQKMIKKNLDISKVIENINYASQIGLITRGFFMLGFPGETVAEIKQTVKLAIDSKLDLASFFEVVTFQRTGLDELVRDMYKDIDVTTNGGYNYLTGKSFYEQVTGFKLTRFIKKSYIRFFSFKRVYKLFIKAPDKIYLFRRILTSGWIILRA